MNKDTVSLVSPESEENLLALCLESTASLLGAIGSGLKPEDFGTPGHELIYRTMRDMTDRGEPVDHATLINHLETSGKLDLVGGRGVIERLTTKAPIHSYKEYAEVIKSSAFRRAMFNGAGDIIHLVETEPDIRSLATGSQNVIYRVCDRLGTGAKGGVHASDLVKMYVNKREEIERIHYPFKTLNLRSKGRERGSLTLWGGFSSDGKTIVGMQAALAAAQTGYRVGYFSLEMTEEELLYRLLAMHSGIPKQKIEDEDIDLTERGDINRAIHAIEQLPIVTYHDPNYTPSEIRTVQMRESFDLIVIDYLQRFDFTDWQDIGRYAKQFKNIALSTKCCVDVLSQLTPRQVGPGQNPFPIPDLNMLFGGRASSHEANNVFFVWAEREKDKETKAWRRTGHGRLISAKQRGGGGEFDFPIRLNTSRIMWEEPDVDNVFILPGVDSV